MAIIFLSVLYTYILKYVYFISSHSHNRHNHNSRISFRCELFNCFFVHSDLPFLRLAYSRLVQLKWKVFSNFLIKVVYKKNNVYFVLHGQLRWVIFSYIVILLNTHSTQIRRGTNVDLWRWIDLTQFHYFGLHTTLSPCNYIWAFASIYIHVMISIEKIYPIRIDIYSSWLDFGILYILFSA